MSLTAQYSNAEHTCIRVVRDGHVSFVPVDPANADYQGIASMDVAPFEPPAVTADMVRGEARRRILAAFPDWKQANMTARAVELIDKQSRGEALTEAEAAERAEIDAAWEWIKAVRAGSNSMEADPPANYADDANWPV